MSVKDITKEEIRQIIADKTGSLNIPRNFGIITDTSDFFKVEYNDVLILGDKMFWVKSCEKEGRFGLDDEPKFWVRRATDLSDGSTKILKMVFHEEFETKVGGVVIKCFRSPKKEGRILDLVANHKNFMHGYWINDAAGNNIRILDFIYGPRFDNVVMQYGSSHEDYFHNYFPDVLNQYIELVEAIKFLHDHGEKHGDIRRDHILFDREAGVNRWIDFDYNYLHGEAKWSFDLQGLGNIIIYLTGRGDVLVPELYHTQRELYDSLWGEDLNISYKNRVANLKKIYPYIPDSLNRVLLHFSFGARIFYDSTGQMLDDLVKARADL
ncbi:MAG: serine/threonine-protein kinase [Desulfobulbaceae bacterium]|nr:serine/threonine-protein kinase [Desulfobulbaceae bacterium]